MSFTKQDAKKFLIIFGVIALVVAIAAGGGVYWLLSILGRHGG